MALGNGMKSILTNGMYLVGSNWIEIVLRAVYVVVITRMLGPELYGVWAYVLAAYPMVIGLTNFGFEPLMHVAFGAKGKNGVHVARVALTTRGVIAVFCAIGWVFYVLVFETEPRVIWVALIIVPALFARMFSNLIRAIFVGLETSGTHVKFVSAIRSAEVLAGTLALTFGGGLAEIATIHAVAWCIDAVVGLYLLKAKHQISLGPMHAETSRMLFREGWLMGMAAALLAALTAGPVLMLKSSGATLTEIGQVGLVLQLAGMFLATVTPFLTAAFPTLMRSDEAGDTRVAYYGWIVAGLTLATCALATVVFYFIGELLIVRLLGEAYRVVGTYLPAATIIAGLTLFPSGFFQLMFVRGLRWPMALGSMFGVAVFLVAFTPSIAANGHFGALLAAALGWGARIIAAVLLGLVLGRSTTAKNAGAE